MKNSRIGLFWLEVVTERAEEQFPEKTPENGYGYNQGRQIPEK
ncbi:hypothetical protein Pla110_26060 [Polystyrenella longa]|uniref:Uncharacterized protein n=1 Tax=Polystyrenella longa TaxID=2528007 RepID=A0A518CNR5_9PLAN|nr:hypothetical protein [Polystyrenella longa]QDU80870.1 hypothetical protein Pla110_26060 [Polystyrenella longa]